MTRPVPKASESGMLRFGSLTSPAVNVMLFQASAENSELVCATQMPTKSPKCRGRRQTAADILQVRREPSKDCRNSLLRHRRATRDRRSSPARSSAISEPVLANVKTFWTSLPSFRAARVHPGQQGDHHHADELRGRERKRVARRADTDRLDHIIRFRDPRNENAAVTRRTRPPPPRSCRSG